MKIKHLLYASIIALLSCGGNSTTPEETSTSDLETETVNAEEVIGDTLTDEMSEIEDEINQIKEESEELGNEIDDLLKDL